MKRHASPGFTLLELLIAMLVLAAVLAISYPSVVRASSSLHLRAAGRDVLNIFRHARQKAVTEQTGMKIIVDPQKQELTLSDSLGDGIRKYTPPRDIKIEQVILAGTSVPDRAGIIRFLPNGSSDSVEILLKSNAGSTLRIVSDPLTGGARIESGAGEP